MIHLENYTLSRLLRFIRDFELPLKKFSTLSNSSNRCVISSFLYIERRTSSCNLTTRVYIVSSQFFFLTKDNSLLHFVKRTSRFSRRSLNSFELSTSMYLFSPQSLTASISLRLATTGGLGAKKSTTVWNKLDISWEWVEGRWVGYSTELRAR
jgi:hypothetical protein